MTVRWVFCAILSLSGCVSPRGDLPQNRYADILEMSQKKNTAYLAQTRLEEQQHILAQINQVLALHPNHPLTPPNLQYTELKDFLSAVDTYLIRQLDRRHRKRQAEEIWRNAFSPETSKRDLGIYLAQQQTGPKDSLTGRSSPQKKNHPGLSHQDFSVWTPVQIKLPDEKAYDLQDFHKSLSDSGQSLASRWFDAKQMKLLLYQLQHLHEVDAFLSELDGPAVSASPAEHFYQRICAHHDAVTFQSTLHDGCQDIEQHPQLIRRLADKLWGYIVQLNFGVDAHPVLYSHSQQRADFEQWVMDAEMDLEYPILNRADKEPHTLYTLGVGIMYGLLRESDVI